MGYADTVPIRTEFPNRDDEVFLVYHYEDGAQVGIDCRECPGDPLDLMFRAYDGTTSGKWGLTILAALRALDRDITLKKQP